MKKKISILGSTGSIGLSALSIIDKKKNFFSINILVANKNFNLICKQLKLYKPNIFIISDFNTFKKVSKKFKGRKIRILNNYNLLKKKSDSSDITISAIPGIAGLEPTIKFIELSKKILIANKESIICGWSLIKKKIKEKKVKLIPIDSEHYSISKLLENTKMNEIEKVYLTASGGPFLNLNYDKLNKVKPHQALKHPMWKMGKKISVDSATLMNKLLEVIEAQKLFSLKLNKIDILIHPESVIHAIVKFKNGLSKFLYHEPNMKIPIANALLEKVNIKDFYNSSDILSNKIQEKKLNFYKVDKKKYSAIKLMRKIDDYPSTPIIINAANEILVDRFLNKKIDFNQIIPYIFAILRHKNYKKNAIKSPKNLKEIFKIDKWSKQTINEIIL